MPKVTRNALLQPTTFTHLRSTDTTVGTKHQELHRNWSTQSAEEPREGNRGRPTRPDLNRSNLEQGQFAWISANNFFPVGSPFLSQIERILDELGFCLSP